MYRFVAKSMLIFVVTLPSGLIKNIEFERCGNDAYSYITDNKQVAECIRKHPLTKAGRIIDESQPEEEQVQQQNEEQVKDENALHFENITKAKNYLAKTFGVDTRKLKSPQSVKDEAKKNGVEMDF